jgi:hypothetical protein
MLKGFVMTCPKCGSEEWKLASVVYAEGIHNLSATTNFFGGGLGADVLGVDIGAGVGRGKTSGTHQTMLSELAAPPVKTPPAKFLSSKWPPLKLFLMAFLPIPAVVVIIVISESLGFNTNIYRRMKKLNILF